MNDHQFQQLKDELRDHVRDTIELTVNGKIRTLNKTVDDFIARAEPAIRAFENLSWSWKMMLGLALFISAIGGAILMLEKLFIHD